MQVSISEISDISDISLGNKGIILSVCDNDGKVKGKLRLGKGKVEWCGRNIQVGRGVQVNWDELIKWFEE